LSANRSEKSARRREECKARARTCALLMFGRKLSDTICALTGRLLATSQSKTVPADVPACGFGLDAFEEGAAAAAGTTTETVAGTDDGGWVCAPPAKLAFLGGGTWDWMAVFCCFELLPAALAPAKSSSLAPLSHSSGLTSRVMLELLRKDASGRPTRRAGQRARTSGGAAERGKVLFSRFLFRGYFVSLQEVCAPRSSSARWSSQNYPSINIPFSLSPCYQGFSDMRVRDRNKS
jgi:hypothetical protein